MNFDLVTYELGELGSLKNGANFNKNDAGDGCPVMSVKQLFRGRFVDTEGLGSIKLGTLKKLDDYLVKKNDLLFARSSLKAEGSGQVAIVNEYPQNCIFSGFTIRFRLFDESKVNPSYLYYLLRSPKYREIFVRITTGSVISNLTQATLSKIPVELPNKETQDYVANILDELDRKRELGAATNQTLEQLAQAIFKSWFVDFDPVKAKMAGEQPEGMDTATASLFPEKLVESELGLIPEGWELKPIKDLCSKVQNGGTPKRSESSYWDDGDIPWLTSGEVRQSIITSVENRITQLGLDKSSAKWVPELSTLVALYGATAGEVSLTSIPLTTNQAVCALMPKKEHQWYNYLQLKNRVAELAGKAVGSAQQNISKGLVESTEVLSAPESLLEAFNAQVENFFKLRICNLQENVELANLRDTLLPKLLSGEIELGQK
ncbi:restriction endonuclease subunit S [Vibrio cyclitrophicus]